MKQKLILIIILITIFIYYYDYDKENFETDKLKNYNNIIITFDENYYYINIEDKSYIDNNNKWSPKKYNIIKIKLN